MSLPPITQEWLDGLPSALPYLQVDLRGVAEHTQFVGSPVTIHCANGTVYRTRRGKLYRLAREVRVLKALSDTKEDSTGKLEDVLERFVRAAQAKGTTPPTDVTEDPVTEDDQNLENPTDVPENSSSVLAPAPAIAPPTPPLTKHGTELVEIIPPNSVSPAPDAAHVALAGVADSMAVEFVDALAQQVNAAIYARFAARRHEIIADACHGLLTSAPAEDSVVSSTPTHRAASALTASSVSP